ncbi:hypothetical protein Slin14017_G054960 [Septoria linicola]|nr:hypothetical protein Slin14017_G054960 [Septoria linicola]
MKFKRIVVELAEEDKSYSSFSHLYVVASLLAVADHKVESIIVHFTNHTLLGRMPQLCWPLKSLTNVKISFSGIEPSSSHELWQFGSVDPPMVLVEWWKLNTEIENYLHLLKAARVRPPGIGVLRLQLHALSKTSRAIVRPLGMGHENDFMSALGPFRAYLRSDKLASTEVDAIAKLAAEGHALPRILSVLELACRGAELAGIGTAC